MQLPDQQQWQTLNGLLDELLALDSAARKGRLESLAREQPELMKPLRRLLASAGKTDTLDAVLGHALHFLSDQEGMPEQRRLGPWRLKSELGRGGMAQVFLAERADGAFEQKVALKLIWPGMAGPNVLARFEQERQILASLDDTRIARLIDGGVAEDGRPWLAMEYIQGIPVDRYCDEHRLDIEARLKLFREIAAAISAAHRRLVVHRDIKPDNVLVTEKGEVKLLDFGIAKLLDADAMPHAAPATRRAERLLTPEYASPEQLTESPITTASDVYQLGALLFQLLTGQPPHRRKGLSTAEFEAAVLAGPPRRPSARIRAATHDSAVRIAGDRGLTRSGLIRRLRGDLDAIVQQAMATDPESRYSSAETLEQDVRNVLRGMPVAAHPTPAVIRFGKFLRRHRAGTAATVLIVLAVFAGLAGTVWQARIATMEARKAGEIKNFLVGLFEVSDPDIAQGREITARELLDQGAARIDRELAEEPAVRAELANTLGEIYLRMGLFEQAEPLLEQALMMRTGLFGADDLATAESLLALGKLHIERGNLDTAETHLNEALSIRRGVLGVGHPEVADVLAEMVGLLRVRRRHADAVPLADEILQIRRRAFSEDDPRVAEALMLVAVLMDERGEPDRAGELYREALEIRRAHFGEIHSKVASVLHNLGFLAFQRGELDEAERVLRQVVDINQQLYGEVYTNNRVRSIAALGRVLEARGALEEAEALYRTGLGMLREILAPRHPSLGGALHAVGNIVLTQGRADEAEPLFAEGLEIYLENFGSDHPATLSTRIALGRARAAAGDQTARGMILEAAERAREVLDDGHPVLLEAQVALREIDR